MNEEQELEAFFNRTLPKSAGERGMTRLIARRRRQRIARLSIGALTAAAMIAIVLVVGQHDDALKQQSPMVSNAPTTEPAVRAGWPDENARDLMRFAWTEPRDLGTVRLTSGLPARAIERVRFEQLEWTDPDGRQHQKTWSPGRDVIYYAMDVQ